MNRRSFIGALAAIPAAVVAGVRFKSPWYFGRDLLHRPTATGTATVREWSKVVNTISYDKVFLARAGESFGNSFAFLKSRAASEIMAKHDKRAIRRWRDYEKSVD